ncbi:MAG: amidohydrolase family protein [Planctomycetaceae bacterium]|nr:amidohydrolase family protein [Planctomycetaceae bacterium]
MQCQYRITNGRVFDPGAGVDESRDVYIRNSRIAAPEYGTEHGAAETVDAKGCLVLPGLIDFHTHLYRGHTDLGIHSDLMTIPNGVTSAVDAGSAGTAGFEGFYKDTVCAADITIRSFILVGAIGVATDRYFENTDPQFYDTARLEYMFERYPEQLLGIKVRIGKLFSKEHNLKPLVEAKRIAKAIGTIVCVHAVHPESPFEEILGVLEKGDILCHCFQSKGAYSILDANGAVSAAARAARERGVVFDAASGRANYSYGVAKQAIDDGFLPDLVTTDVVTVSMYERKVFSLPYVMSAYLALGMPLADLVRAVTATAAQHMRLSGRIGTLAPGALADVAIVKLDERPMAFDDQFGNVVKGDKLFVPMQTFKAGRNMFTRIDFAF